MHIRGWVWTAFAFFVLASAPLAFADDMAGKAAGFDH